MSFVVAHVAFLVMWGIVAPVRVRRCVAPAPGARTVRQQICRYLVGAAHRL